MATGSTDPAAGSDASDCSQPRQRALDADHMLFEAESQMRQRNEKKAIPLLLFAQQCYSMNHTPMDNRRVLLDWSQDRNQPIQPSDPVAEHSRWRATR